MAKVGINQLKSKKKVLGRGLGALITDSKSSGRAGNLLTCDLSKLSPGLRQPRKKFVEGALVELSNSIKENGIIEPLVVRKSSGGYEIIAGERRFRAAKMAGLKEVPIVVMDVTDEKSLELAIIENVQREDLNPIEEAEAYKSLMDFGMSQDGVAKKVGKERATVANYLRLNKLPTEVKAELIKGTIMMGHARAILSVSSAAGERELCRKVVKKGLSVRETEELARSMSLKGKSSKTTAKKIDLQVRAIENELKEIFAAKVSLKDRSGKGKIEISYFNSDERERILEILRTIK